MSIDQTVAGVPASRYRRRPYNAPQLRLDTWNDLRIHADWLYERLRRDRDFAEPRGHLADDLETLRILERYWAFPGADNVEELTRLFDRHDFDELARRVSSIARLLVGDMYRHQGGRLAGPRDDGGGEGERRADATGSSSGPVRPYFEVLVVDDIDASDRRELRERLVASRREEDEFVYDLFVVPSFEDAVIGVLFNRTVQACVLRYDYGFPSAERHDVFKRYLDLLERLEPRECYGLARSLDLGRIIKALRPEVDLYLVTDTPLDEVAGKLGRNFRRTFYRLDQYLELHLSILKGIRTRYATPFFDALRRFSQKPTGVFHALPIARGKSMMNSFWARDLARFYGANLFLAETSATSGGLDSLLQPHGPIKEAQRAASRAFGGQETFFVTNGTSTANKIVVQALVRPGDVVLTARDCHKSHHYAIMLAGAYPVYLDAYPLTPYSMYGAVPLAEIKRQLLDLRRAGKLDRVRLVLLTNCTFDGITYDPERVMAEILAIKPDMIFLWDEAWFAYARFSPTLRRRTAMATAARLRARFADAGYRAEYARWKTDFETRASDDDAWLEGTLLPDPERARVRVYATHSTHKTLTALRQGSMIHVYDQDFEQKVADSFDEAFMTHTSTSPNYQIVASLDVGRRQVELEGYELVQRSIGLSMMLRERISEHPEIRRYFSVLRPADMIPEEFRPSGLESYYDPEQGWHRMEGAWHTDEFALDPTRVTVHVGETGLDGDRFRNLLMDEHDIQINKTTRNTVLFMTNIGTTRGDVAYLVEVLARIAQETDERLGIESVAGRRLHEDRVAGLTERLPPLPNFSRFHDSFRPEGDGTTREGDLRRAFFMAYDDACCEYLELDGSVAAAIESGREVVSACFVTPYPPGFPVLVPGQVISRDILDYLNAVDVKEIHGYKPEYGLRVFTEDALTRAGASRTLEAAPRDAGALTMSSTTGSKRGKATETRPAKSGRTAAASPAGPGAPLRSDRVAPGRRKGAKLRGLSDIRRFFYRNDEPIYFVSATNFNLLGIDEWVRRFSYINYIDCFDGEHPSVFVPAEADHEPFTSIEDINNYLLAHKEVVDFVRRRGPGGKAVFLMFDEETEGLCRELDLEVCFPPARLRQQIDDKIETTRIADRAGVKSVPNVLAKVDSYATLRRVAKKLGDDVVIQTAYGDSGHTTFFISGEADFREHEEEIASAPEVKIMKRIRCRGSAIEACVTRHGTIVGPLMTELVGFPELTPYRGGWCGNEVFADAFDRRIRQRARDAAFAFGEELRKVGYLGYFELDFLTDLDSGRVYLGECNPRITGASSMTNLAAFAHADAPLFLFHLLEWMDVDYELDVEALNARWADPANIDTWSQLVIKHPGEEVDRITAAPRSGIWELEPSGGVHYVRMQTHRRTVQYENRAFFLRISGPGDYRYEGADLGILVSPGRFMDEDFRLNDRAQTWIEGLRGQYRTEPIEAAAPSPARELAEVGGFKLL